MKMKGLYTQLQYQSNSINTTTESDIYSLEVCALDLQTIKDAALTIYLDMLTADINS